MGQGLIGYWQLMLEMSWRSLVGHRVKSLVVSAIIILGGYLLVVADAMIDSINRAMKSSITMSITGDLQLYDANAVDKLSLMGFMGSFGAGQLIGTIPDFKAVREVVEQHPNVAAVVPMGTDMALIYQGNAMDQAITRLRSAVQKHDEQNVEKEKETIRFLTQQLLDERKLSLSFTKDKQKMSQEITLLETVMGEDFWKPLQDQAQQTLQFLDTKVAPLDKQAEPIFLEFLGTDLTRFQRYFSRFRIVKGVAVPDGQRGLLMNEEQYNRFLKDRVAQMFDQVKDAKQNDDATIANDVELHQLIKERSTEYQPWFLSLEDGDKNRLKQQLQALLQTSEEDLSSLFESYLKLNDDNFEQRYDFFYQQIAPYIELFRVKVGDVITLNKFGTGQSIRVKFYGTFDFEGVEKSGFSGLYNLIDIVSFREMYGFMSDDALAEFADLKEQLNSVAVDSDAAEDALFGDSSYEVDANFNDLAPENGSAESPFASAAELLSDDFVVDHEGHSEGLLNTRYTQQEIDGGPALNAAIILKNPRDLERSKKEIKDLLAQHQMALNVIDWQEAAGFVGQMIAVMRIVLYTFIVFVFCVAMVVVNNAMLMATIQRYTEIGTLRAIGASRGVIMGIFLMESLILTLVAAFVGVMLGVLTIEVLNNVGLDAPNQQFRFLFGGEQLFPSISFENLYLGPLVIFVVSLLATLYPAYLATRIPPVVAMGTGE